MADLIAELDGFRSELEGYERSAGRLDRKDRIKAVKGEIERVQGSIRLEAERLVAQAETHEEAGQDVLAAQCRVEAKRLVREGGLGQAETAADTTPKDKAVPAKGNKRGGE